jgi:PhnB protein
MRFLQIVSSPNTNTNMSSPPDPAHMAKVRASIGERIANGSLLATGALGKRATAGARIVKNAGQITVEDPPSGDGWMAGGGYALMEYPSKEEAVANAKRTLEMMGDAVVELIAVSEMHPPAQRALQPGGSPTLPSGVIPYLSIDGASEASAFYQKAFGAKELARMPGQDGKRLMHCHLEINGGAFMLSDNFPEMGLPPVQRSSSYTMQLMVPDGDAWWNRAISAGCTQKLPFEVAPWGDKYGQLVDPFGVTWALSTPAKR